MRKRRSFSYIWSQITLRLMQMLTHTNLSNSQKLKLLIHDSIRNHIIIKLRKPYLQPPSHWTWTMAVHTTSISAQCLNPFIRLIKAKAIFGSEAVILAALVNVASARDNAIVDDPHFLQKLLRIIRLFTISIPLFYKSI